ncbi:alpha-amylase family protein [Agarivorans litoreus]|uniref:alpha-amylase family protein n=1 Tax=Agarivorans litoreus TaxID=1510455 RepID=UPI001C7CD666|nr:alpha-amylase family protein [Agarivorans litoreus]
MTFMRASLATSLALLLAACGSSGDSGSGDGGSDLAPPTNATQITTAKEAAQSRLPCETAAGEFCDLRIYQVMTESFINGDGNIGHGEGYGTSHHMGDIQGIIDSLDYIAGLGVNALWLTPVFESAPVGGQSIWDDRLDATGYFASDFFKIDPNFGDLDKAKELVTKAHEKGLYVFFDGVFGHHKESGVQPSPNGLTPAGGHNPVDYTDPDTLAFFQEVTEYWTTELCLDGWRLDQAYQVPLSAWSEIQQTLNEAGTTNAANSACNVNGTQWGTLGYMVAEIWKGNSDIVNEAYGSNASPGLPSAFDFGRRYALVQTLAAEEEVANSGNSNKPATKLLESWHSHDTFPDHAQPNLMLGNHDLVRFGDLIQRGGLDNYWERHKAAFSYMAAYSGPITLYYGEEIGDEIPDYSHKTTNNCAERGLCDDHVARSSAKIAGVTDGFTPNAEQQDLMDYLSSLMEVRKNNPALYEGSVQNLYVDSSLLVISKETDSQQVVYFLNTSTSDRTANLSTTLINDNSQLKDLISGDVITADGNLLEVAISGLSGRLLLVE